MRSLSISPVPSSEERVQPRECKIDESTRQWIQEQSKPLGLLHNSHVDYQHQRVCAVNNNIVQVNRVDFGFVQHTPVDGRHEEGVHVA